jgi:hypothetical protein
MDSKQKQGTERLFRVQAFMPSHPAPPPFDFSAGIAELNSVIDELTAQALAQAAGRRASRAETQRLKRSITVLRMHHLKPVVVIARGSMRAKPGIQAALKVPRSNMPVTRMLQEARAIRNVASEYAEVFTRKGRPEDFLERLDDAIDAVQDSFTRRSEQIGATIAANSGITQSIARGVQAVAQLDSVVTVAFEDNLAVLREWEVAKRVQSLPGGPPTELPVETKVAA